MKRLLPSIAGVGSVIYSLLYSYILLRSRLNGLGWVAVSEPNTLVLLLELGVLMPLFAGCGLYTIHQQLWRSQHEKT